MSASAAFGDMLVRHLPTLRRFAANLCRNRADADDLIQDCLVGALRNAHQFTPGTNLQAWLVTIMRNQFYSQHRKAGRFINDPDGLCAERTVGSDGPAEAYEAREAIAILLTEVRREHADAIVSAAMGASLADMAARFGVPEGTIKSRISRGRRHLAALVG